MRTAAGWLAVLLVLAVRQWWARPAVPAAELEPARTCCKRHAAEDGRR